MADFSGLFILTDLDGTLLGPDTLVSDENRAAARYFMENGGLFSFATGRSRPGAAHFADIPVNAPAVLNNGSYGFDFAANRDSYVWDVDKADSLALMAAVSAAFPTCGIEIIRDDGPWIVRHNAAVERHMRYIKVGTRRVTPEDVTGRWISLGVLDEPERMADLTAWAKAHFGGQFFIQQSMAHFLEIQRPGAHKGNGALELCRQLGIDPENLYAVGDGLNDVELLEVTQNRFAPANACEAVLALSPTLLPGHDAHILPALIEIIEKRGTHHGA